MALDYFEKEQIRNKVETILKSKKLENLIKKNIEFEFMTASKHGGQYLHTTKSKVRAKISINKLIEILEKDFELPLTVNQKLALKENKFIEAISEDERSQIKNKQIAIERLMEKVKNLIDKLFPKPRIQTSTEPFESEEKRIKEKKIKSIKKSLRKKLKF